MEPCSDPAAILLAEAVACQERSEYAEAIALLRRLLSVQPAHAEAHTRLGWMLWRLGQAGEAVAEHRQALDAQPGFACAWSNLAVALREQGKHDEALAALQQAVSLAPNIPETHVNLGIAWQDRGLPSHAVACHRHALSLDAGLAEAWINLGLAMQEGGDLPACVAAYRQALRLRPDDWRALSNLQMALQYMPGLAAAELRREAALAGQGFPGELALPKRDPWRKGRRLRVGYVSSDFYAHPVGWLGVRALTAHDRDAVEVHCYAQPARTDFLTDEIRAGVEYWHEVRHLSDAELRELILSHGIDVLVDLGGHTAGNRLPVFACRAAPVQLGWLGFAGSTGLAAIDGIVLGAAQAPPGTQEGYVEPVLALPRCHFTYRPPDYAPAVSPPPAERNGVLTLGSFNNPAKPGAGVLRVWADILKTLPDSRLVLKWRSLADPALAERLRQHFALLGVDPGRVELRGASPHPQMLAEYGDIDIALDPFPFGGGLTTCEALWMGVPVVTLPWRRPVSRQGLAILDALGLADLAADTPREYVATVRRLAADTQRRAALRTELRARMKNSALFDGASLARTLESIFVAACAH